MEPETARLHTFRRRIARILRRAESHPERAALFLRNETGDLLQDLRRLSRAEPATVLDVLLLLLERLSETLGTIEDRNGFAATLIPEITARAATLIHRDALAEEQRFDHARALQRLFRFFVDDDEGLFEHLVTVFQDLASTRFDRPLVMELIRTHLRSLPLLMPLERASEYDLRRTLAHAERHRFERLLGEILASGGSSEYATLVARDHYRRTGDALDLVINLQRMKLFEEAVVVARRALASPRSIHRIQLQEILDELLTKAPAPKDREARRALEQTFLGAPSQKTWRVLKSVVPVDQWARVKSRLLSHLQKHQKAPTVLFQIYLEEGDLLEADGLVVTQPVEADALSNAAKALAEAHPGIAAGWYLLAAHRRLSTRRAAHFSRAIADLSACRDLARQSGQVESFERAFERFRSRYADLPRLQAILDRAGFG